MYMYTYLLINRPHLQTKLNINSPERFLTLIMQLNWYKCTIVHSNLCGILDRKYSCEYLQRHTLQMCPTLRTRSVIYITESIDVQIKHEDKTLSV